MALRPAAADPRPKAKSNTAIDLAIGAAKNARESAAVLRENDDWLVITDELIKACKSAASAWDKLATRLIKKQASTLPQDGRSDDAVDDPTPENEGDDIGDIPAGFDRRSA